METTRDGTGLPNLLIVPTDSIVPHERPEAQRSEPLVERLRNEGILKNPPIVAPIQDSRYVILDGTNRVLAVSALAYPHIIVQVVDYEDPNLILDTWSHLVCEMAYDDFFSELYSIDGLRVENAGLRRARAELKRRHAAAYIIAPAPPSGRKRRVWKSRIRKSDVHVLYVNGDQQYQADVINRVVNKYMKHSTMHRTDSTHFNKLAKYYDEVMALVVFPHYKPSEIMEFARRGVYLPSGITRHVIPGRALRVNFPIDVLADERSIEEKNAQLQEWLRDKLARKDVRYYQESTFLFDE